MKKIVLTGGGTAGHVMPHLALIGPLLDDGWQISYIGSVGGMEEGIVGDIPGVAYYKVKAGKLRRYIDLKNLSDPFRVIAGAWQAAKLMRKIKPDIVFSKGGYVSVPVVLGAKLCGVPVVLHESDMTSGLANKICLPFAKAVCTTFAETAKALGEKGVHTGTPMRPALFAGSRERGLAMCGFSGKKPVLLVTGGSLGAVAVNELVRKSLPGLAGFDILHLCGKGNLDESLAGRPGYVQKEFLLNEMADALTMADVVISRAGSNTICELLALKKPALFIPYPTGASRGDQIDNALSFEARGYARVLMQEEATSELLIRMVGELYREKDRYIATMSAAKDADGTRAVLEQLYKYARK